MEISLTEENYIKAIFSLNQINHKAGVSTNALSENLNNKAGSVTDMLKRLAEKKIIHYEKYKGVFLTSKGERIALDIVRKHRLWEVFLMEKLNFKWDEVHDIAEQLEHIKSDELVDRLDVFLGKPKFDPHGDPIPDATGHLNNVKAKPLTNYKTKNIFVFVGVTEHSKSFLQHLTSIGLKIGDTIKVEEINEFDNSFKVKINKNSSQFFSDKVSSNILVEIKK
ncbi:metal-dependent transcriptional regulator [Aurantibacillus circumpalustris]|uniref:metal-dependent transcriptional regulator n=1 Tax=Aurantibacillus circumpalustris TaxID=3036359 RepID=UPI00295AB6EB|nr:metal-dependent transcriptional regulator [Aurantibacillus circumpalustris]